MLDIAKTRTTAGHAPILDIEVLLLDEDSRSEDALRAQLTPQEAAQWTKVCVQQHLI